MSRPLKYRFPAGDVRKDVPNYIKKDGFHIPLKNSTGYIVSEARLNELGILVLVEANPDAGKVITQSHGEMIDGDWVEVIDEQKTPEEIAAAKALAVNRFSKLKIVRAMRVLGKSANLQALLDSNPVFKEDWDAAVEIDLSDEITQQAITAYGGDINEIKLKIAEA
jgi:hypothetical protein